MADFSSWYIIIESYITLILVGWLTIALLRNFLRKKTTGTLMLFTAYAVLFFMRIASSLEKTLQIFGVFGNGILIIISISSVTPLLTAIFLYAFASRHILNDSEYLQTLTMTFISAIFGVILTLLIASIYLEIPEGIFAPEPKTVTPDIQAFSITFASICLIVIQMLIYLRLTISSFILARNTEEIVRKRGFQIIGWGVLLFILAGLVRGVEGTLDIAVAGELVVNTLRSLMFLASYYLLYLGWTMPNWYRKRLRKRTWFETQYVTSG
ncbi:MAG: hypothetical protein GF308_14340 [Candidatus Heimdallarchaeota archaeon]|nr:hypothetical protein [Candidatus Heimdallarchaeota archaeon]